MYIRFQLLSWFPIVQSRLFFIALLLLMFNTISLIVDFTKDTQKGKEKHASYLCTVLHLIPGSSCQRHAHVML